MNKVAFSFLFSASIYLALGMVFGIYMGVADDRSLSPAHGHLNLFGWVTLALFGLFYQVVPAAADRLGNIHFWLSTAAVWVFVPGIALAFMGVSEFLVVLGSFMALASLLMFLFIVWRSRNAT
jgi:cbb3-type cytochrome oxidase subunit 1